MILNRRQMLAASAAVVGSISSLDGPLALGKEVRSNEDLHGLIGVTTGSFQRNYSPNPEDGKLRLLDLPKILREELGMKVLDVMTASFPTMEPRYLDDFRSQAEKAGCVITNLKMNQPKIDIGSNDPSERKMALEIYQKSIDDAERLGCRWVRPLPLNDLPSMDSYVDSYRRLIDYAAPKGISLLVENYGWMKAKPEAVPNLIRAVGSGLAAQPDTGNWTDEARYEGLEKAFPFAVTCDFKAFAFDANGRHAAYDLERCFQIAWKAGFRGPWCFEHFNTSLRDVFKEMIMLREMIETWTKKSLQK